MHVSAGLLERVRARAPAPTRLSDEAVAEHALAMYALDRELLNGDCQSVLTDADASRLLLDELHQRDVCRTPRSTPKSRIND